MTPNDQLTELYELLGKGRHQAWPDPVYREFGRWMYLGRKAQTEHALAIVRDSIEGWLVDEMDFRIERWRDSVEYSLIDGSRGFDGLTDTVRYALNHPPHDGQRPIQSSSSD